MADNINWPVKTRELHNHHFDSSIWNDLKFRDDGCYHCSENSPAKRYLVNYYDHDKENHRNHRAACSIDLSGTSRWTVDRRREFHRLGRLGRRSTIDGSNGFPLPHGLGVKVKDAQTKIQIAKGSKHPLWVRTRDWVGKWKSQLSDAEVVDVQDIDGFYEIEDIR